MVGGDPQVRALDSSLSVLREYREGRRRGGGGQGPSASEIIPRRPPGRSRGYEHLGIWMRLPYQPIQSPRAGEEEPQHQCRVALHPQERSLLRKTKPQLKKKIVLLFKKKRKTLSLQEKKSSHLNQLLKSLCG